MKVRVTFDTEIPDIPSTVEEKIEFINFLIADGGKITPVNPFYPENDQLLVLNPSNITLQSIL